MTLTTAGTHLGDVEDAASLMHGMTPAQQGG